jgi:hypothetical protein
MRFNIFSHKPSGYSETGTAEVYQYTVESDEDGEMAEVAADELEDQGHTVTAILPEQDDRRNRRRR